MDSQRASDRLTSANSSPATQHDDAFLAGARRWRWLALGLILLGGAALRMVDLEHTPYGIWFDEAINGMDAVNVWRPGGHFHMYYSVDIGFPHEPLFQTGLNLVVGAFGPSVVAVRAYSAVIGLLTVLLVYLFARRWLGEIEGLAAAGALATMRWHAIFSRLSFRTLILGPWMLGLTWAALACARRPSKKSALALGFFIGGGFYTYLSWWFMLPVAAGAVAWIAWSEMRTGAGRRRLGLLALAAALTYLPMGLYTLQHPDIVTRRAKAVSIFSEGVGAGARAILRNGGETLLMFHFWGDHVPNQNIPGPGPVQAAVLRMFGADPARTFIGRPALDPLQGIALIAGIWLLARMWRGERRLLAVLLFGWLAFGMASTVFTVTDSPNFLRTLCITPVVAALVGLGLAEASRAAARRWGARAGAALLGLALLYSGAQAAWDIYGVWGRRADVWQRFHGDLTDLARAADQAPPEVAVMFPGERYEHPAVQFQTATRKNIYPYHDLKTALGPWPPSEPARAGGQKAPKKRWIIVTGDNPVGRRIVALMPQASVVREFYHPALEGNWAAMISVTEESLPAAGALKEQGQ